jgi:hypothetical protein
MTQPSTLILNTWTCASCLLGFHRQPGGFHLGRKLYLWVPYIQQLLPFWAVPVHQEGMPVYFCRLRLCLRCRMGCHDLLNDAGPCRGVPFIRGSVYGALQGRLGMDGPLVITRPASEQVPCHSRHLFDSLWRRCRSWSYGLIRMRTCCLAHLTGNHACSHHSHLKSTKLLSSCGCVQLDAPTVMYSHGGHPPYPQFLNRQLTWAGA